MKGKTFTILLVVAAVLVGVALLRQGGDKPAGEVKMGEKLFADLPVNQVAAVTIADADNRVTLVRGDAAWQVEERDGYPADFDDLRDTVVKLSRLKIGRTFAGTPESLARLSLLPPTATEETGRGQSITLKDSGGKVLTDVILGQTRETDGGGSGGQYLKLADGETVYLVDGNFRFLKTTPTDWLQKEILDIKGADVRDVACYVAGSPDPAYRLSRAAKGEAAALAPLPDGRQADAAKIDQVLDALAPLTMDDVKTADTPPPADATRLVYDLFDGRRITLYPHAGDGETYTIRISAAEVPPVADAPADTAAEGTDSEASDGAEEKPAGDPAESAPVIKTAQEINDTLGPWIFTIKKWQYDSFIADPAALLEAPETKPDTAS